MTRVISELKRKITSMWKMNQNETKMFSLKSKNNNNIELLD